MIWEVLDFILAWVGIDIYGDEMRIEVLAETGAVARVALIAGGSCDIGGAIARRLARNGARVLVGYCARAEAAQATAEQINAAGGRAQAVPLDVLDAAAVEAVCQGIHERHGRLDILVNGAAINVEAPALGLADEDWDRVLATNVSAAFRLCRAAAKYMVLGRWGRIVNISSIAAVHGGRGQVNYAASKAALESMTRVLALELGRKGVRANCVAPGTIASGMSERVRAEHEQELLGAIAVRRFGAPEDVAETVAFLASDAADYITGQVIRVDGGMWL